MQQHAITIVEPFFVDKEGKRHEKAVVVDGNHRVTALQKMLRSIKNADELKEIQYINAVILSREIPKNLLDVVAYALNQVSQMTVKPKLMSDAHSLYKIATNPEVIKDFAARMRKVEKVECRSTPQPTEEDQTVLTQKLAKFILKVTENKGQTDEQAYNSAKGSDGSISVGDVLPAYYISVLPRVPELDKMEAQNTNSDSILPRSVISSKDGAHRVTKHLTALRGKLYPGTTTRNPPFIANMKEHEGVTAADLSEYLFHFFRKIYDLTYAVRALAPAGVKDPVEVPKEQKKYYLARVGRSTETKLLASQGFTMKAKPDIDSLSTRMSNVIYMRSWINQHLAADFLASLRGSRTPAGDELNRMIEKLKDAARVMDDDGSQATGGSGDFDAQGFIVPDFHEVSYDDCGVLLKKYCNFLCRLHHMPIFTDATTASPKKVPTPAAHGSRQTAGAGPAPLLSQPPSTPGMTQDGPVVRPPAAIATSEGPASGSLPQTEQGPVRRSTYYQHVVPGSYSHYSIPLERYFGHPVTDEDIKALRQDLPIRLAMDMMKSLKNRPVKYLDIPEADADHTISFLLKAKSVSDEGPFDDINDTSTSYQGRLKAEVDEVYPVPEIDLKVITIRTSYGPHR